MKKIASLIIFLFFIIANSAFADETNEIEVALALTSGWPEELRQAKAYCNLHVQNNKAYLRGSYINLGKRVQIIYTLYGWYEGEDAYKDGYKFINENKTDRDIYNSIEFNEIIDLDESGPI